MSREPSAHYKTIRKAISDELAAGMCTVRELSQAVGASEKQVVEHLFHVEKSAKGMGYRFVKEPSECLSCGFVFKERERFAKPGKCPECKASHISQPMFGLKG